MKNTLSKRLVLILAASLLAVPCFAADGPGDPGDPNGSIFKKKDKDDQTKDKKTPKQLVSSSVKASETPIPRIWIGLTGSYTPLKLIHTNTSGLTDSSGDTELATGAQGLAGGGLTVNARILHNYWLSIGAIYRYTGYDWQFNSADTNLDSFVERSRVRLLDIPVMVKYTGRKWNISKYTFYELGGTYRDAFSRRTTTNWSDFASLGLGPIPTGLFSINNQPIVNVRRGTYGAVAGAGLTGKDDFGIIVSPEIRYTRWMGDTFGSNVLGSQKNQLEVTVSFGF